MNLTISQKKKNLEKGKESNDGDKKTNILQYKEDSL